VARSRPSSPRPIWREGVLAELRRIGGVERTNMRKRHARLGWVPTHAARRFDSYAVRQVSQLARAGLAEEPDHASDDADQAHVAG